MSIHKRKPPEQKQRYKHEGRTITIRKDKLCPACYARDEWQHHKPQANWWQCSNCGLTLDDQLRITTACKKPKREYFRKLITIYILELEHGCFYVGQTNRIKTRMRTHEEGLGSRWTKLHKPVATVMQLQLDTGSPVDAMAHENYWTWHTMRQHGWQRVRGGDFCHPNEKRLRRDLVDAKRYDELQTNNPLTDSWQHTTCGTCSRPITDCSCTPEDLAD